MFLAQTSPSNGETNASAAVGEIARVLSVLLSTVLLSGINIAISGHLLGYALALGKDDNDQHFTLWVPGMFRMKIKGSYVFAGFAAFSISLVIVGWLLSAFAKSVFIDNLKATDSQWTASQGLAAVLSVTICLLLSAIRVAGTVISAIKAPPLAATPNSDEDRVRALTENRN